LEISETIKSEVDEQRVREKVENVKRKEEEIKE
jgi:hypothetical protein